VYGVRATKSPDFCSDNPHVLRRIGRAAASAAELVGSDISRAGRAQLSVPVGRRVRRHGGDLIQKGCGCRQQMQIAGCRVDEQRGGRIGVVAAHGCRRAVPRRHRAIENVVGNDDAARVGKAVLDRVRVGARDENGVVQHLRARRVADVDRRVPRQAAKDEVVPDDAAGMIVRRALDQTKRDLALAVDERVAVDDRARRRVPHQDRRPGQLRRRADVPEEIVPDDPFVGGMHAQAIRVVVAAGRLVLDDRVLDDAVVHAAARAVRVGLDELLAGVDEPDVVDERRLRAGIEHDRVVVDVANGQVRDRHAANVAADPHAERNAAVGRRVHAAAHEHHVVAIAGCPANPHIRERAVDVQRRREVVGAWRDHDGGVRGHRGNGVLQLRDGRDVDDGAGGWSERHRRHGRTGSGDSAEKQAGKHLYDRECCRTPRPGSCHGMDRSKQKASATAGPQHRARQPDNLNGSVRGLTVFG
jgi:hypothetical protein